MIKTGFKKLDQSLGGGIKEGLITDIYGQTATGKTQLTFQICLNALKSGKEILFQDTTGGFRPERILEMMKAQHMDPVLLDKIKVGRITNTSQQIQYLSKIPIENFSLIIIDNITDLFSFEYSKKEQSFEKHISFMRYMQNLSNTAINNRIPIVVTNIVRNVNEQEKENLEKPIGMYTHVKIKLTKNNKEFFCEITSPFQNESFAYVKTLDGLSSPP